MGIERNNDTQYIIPTTYYYFLRYKVRQRNWKHQNELGIFGSFAFPTRMNGVVRLKRTAQRFAF